MKKLDIVYKDKYLLVVNKKANYLTLSTDKNKYNNLYREVSAYVKKSYPKNKVFIINRLDKDVSGLVLFAKSYSVKTAIQNEWDNVKRTYLALVEGYVEKDKGDIKLYLKEDNNYNIYVDKDGKKAITKYEVIHRFQNKTLVKIFLVTGRKHQIRVSLKEIGHPIVGDKRYGAKTNPYRRVMLHSASVSFKHPINGNLITLDADIPKSFIPKE